MTYPQLFIPATAAALVHLLLNITCHASNRVALVIGNGEYSASPLKNPVNDATDIANLLEKLDFEVIKETNASKKEMLAAVNRFSSQLKKSEVGIFYFAGHGMQINNRNYLIPIGVNVFEESDVEYEAVDTGRIISKMRTAENKLNVIILDACRNNPFQRSFRSSSQGLARMDAPKGTIIAYTTSPGSIAADGKGPLIAHSTCVFNRLQSIKAHCNTLKTTWKTTWGCSGWFFLRAGELKASRQ